MAKEACQKGPALCLSLQQTTRSMCHLHVTFALSMCLAQGQTDLICARQMCCTTSAHDAMFDQKRFIQLMCLGDTSSPDYRGSACTTSIDAPEHSYDAAGHADCHSVREGHVQGTSQAAYMHHVVIQEYNPYPAP